MATEQSRKYSTEGGLELGRPGRLGQGNDCDAVALRDLTTDDELTEGR